MKNILALVLVFVTCTAGAWPSVLFNPTNNQIVLPTNGISVAGVVTNNAPGYFTNTGTALIGIDGSGQVFVTTNGFGGSSTNGLISAGDIKTFAATGNVASATSANSVPWSGVTGTGQLGNWWNLSTNTFALYQPLLGFTPLNTATYNAAWGNFSTNVLGTFAASANGTGVGVQAGAALASGVLSMGVTNKFTNTLSVVIGSNHITATLTTNSTGLETLTISDATQTNQVCFTNNAGQVVLTNLANVFGGLLAGLFNGSILNSNSLVVNGDVATLGGFYYLTNTFTGRCGDSYVTNVPCFAAGFNTYPSGTRVFLIYTPFTNASHSLSFATPQWAFVGGSGVTIYKYSANILGPYTAVGDANAITVAYQFTQPVLADTFGNINLYGANVFGGHFYGDISTASNLPPVRVTFGSGDGGQRNFTLGNGTDGRVYFSSLDNYQLQDAGGYYYGTGSGTGDDDYYVAPVNGWYEAVVKIRIDDGTDVNNGEGIGAGLPGELSIGSHDYPEFYWFGVTAFRLSAISTRIVYLTAGQHLSMVTASDNNDFASDGSMTINFLHP